MCSSDLVPDVEVTAETGNASAANINLITEHEVSMALVQNDVSYLAVKGEKPFNKPVENLRMIASLYPEHMQCISIVTAFRRKRKAQAHLDGFADLRLDVPLCTPAEESKRFAWFIFCRLSAYCLQMIWNWNTLFAAADMPRRSRRPCAGPPPVVRYLPALNSVRRSGSTRSWFCGNLRDRGEEG